MTTYGTVQIGRLILREDDGVDFAMQESSQGTKITLTGQESVDRLGFALMKKRMDDIIGLGGKMLPIQFSQKAELNGFYNVGATVSGTYRSWAEQSASIMPWTVPLELVGYP